MTDSAVGPAEGMRVEKLTLNTAEVCQALGISNVTLWRWVKQGRLTPITGLRTKLYSVAAVRRFVENGGEA